MGADVDDNIGDVILGKVTRDNVQRVAGANSRQVGGDHYKTDGKGEEHWDRVARLGMDYWQACSTKYIERCWEKNGLEDIEKAIHYLQKYAELIREGKVRQEEQAAITALDP